MFCRTHSNISGKYSKIAQTRKRKADPKPKKEKKAHLHNLLGQNTTEDMTQAQLEAY
jgi:hypothetical protein